MLLYLSENLENIYLFMKTKDKKGFGLKEVDQILIYWGK